MLNFSEIKCVGCTACASVCPKNIIDMKRNSEGFQYPLVESTSECIECGLCEEVCPVLNFRQETKFQQKGLIAQIKDEKIRHDSTSGGMFSAIALSVLDNNGIVYGAAFNESFEVCHMGISDKEDLWKIRGSKYVQSNLVGVFNEVKQYLESGKQVCFSGTPCQVEGLQFYLRKDYNNLLLVDVVCHGVSSPLIWEKYLESMKKYNPSRIYFRWKHYGYKYSTMSLFDSNNNEVYFAGVESDKMLRAYGSNNCLRDTCCECIFKKRYRTSDFTIWDWFHPKFFNKDFDDDIGTTAVLVHSKKASKWLIKMINSNMIKYCFVSPDELTLSISEMVNSVKKGDFRDNFLEEATYLSGEKLFNKYFPCTFKTKLERLIRLILLRLGLYNIVRYQLFIYRRNKYESKKKAG